VSTSITFTDGTGAATLTNGKPAPADRFQNWEPISPQGENADWVTGLNGTRYQWSYRSDYGARFDLDKIPAAKLSVALRLLRWLAAGNTCTVNTGDRSTNSYTCRAFPGWQIPDGPKMTDTGMIEYTLSLVLKNTSAADMLCQYLPEPT
jgi:hypothetical protein